MESLTSPEAGLTGLFLSAFLAATLLPGGSEVAFVAFVSWQPASAWTALGVATLGNTLGGLTSVWLGRRLPEAPAGRHFPRLDRWMKRHGAFTLLLAWLPVVGDALCVLAGWRRVPWGPATLCMGLGKGLRYLALLVWVG
ncbi:MAG: DedA family protein [Betaproteobacteria bacterium]|nr:DedA family protein [Betaproteobacteria bacterium]